MVSDILQIFTNYYREFQIGGFNGPFDPSKHSPTPWLFIDPLSTPWLFIDPLDGPIDPWGSILTTLRTPATNPVSI